MKISKFNLILSRKRKPVLVKEKTYYTRHRKVSSSEDVVNLTNRIFRLSEQAEEKLVMLCLDITCRPFAAFEVSHGNCGSSIVGVREIFIRALKAGAVYIAVAHNHPSGDPEPSEMDWKVFLRLKEAREILGVPVIEQIVIGDGAYYSMETNYKENSNSDPDSSFVDRSLAYLQV